MKALILVSGMGLSSKGYIPNLLHFFAFLVMPAVIIRQRKPYRRKNGVFIYFEGSFQTYIFHLEQHIFHCVCYQVTCYPYFRY